MHLQYFPNQIPECFEISSYICLSSRLTAILAGSMVAIFILLVIKHLYQTGCPAAVKVVASVYSRFYRVWPTFVFIHTTLVIAFASFLSFVGFLPFTQELIVNITAVYATILFLEGTLRTKVPLLDVEFQNDPPWSMEADTDLINDPDAQFVVKQKITVKNFGDASADNLSIECRAICPGEGITREWQQVTFADDDSPTIQPNDTKETELVLDTFDEYNGQEYLTEIKAKPNVRQGHLAIRRFHRTVPRQPDSS